MIVRSDCTQLENNGLYLNIENDDYHHLGVWTGCYNNKCVLYKYKDELWFMTFKSVKHQKEFEDKHSILKMVWESKS